MISEEEAEAMCREVVDLFLRSRSCRAVLLGGGVERAAERYVAEVLERWADDHELALVPQHKADRKVADYAFCALPDQETYCLSARGVLEVKGNYASQRTEFIGKRRAGDRSHRNHLPRLLQSAIQVAEYSQSRSEGEEHLPAFIMYVVARGQGQPPPNESVSSGAAHFIPAPCLSDALYQLTMQGDTYGYAEFRQAIKLLGCSYQERDLETEQLVCLLFSVNVSACLDLGTRFPRPAKAKALP